MASLGGTGLIVIGVPTNSQETTTATLATTSRHFTSNRALVSTEIPLHYCNREGCNPQTTTPLFLATEIHGSTRHMTSFCLVRQVTVFSSTAIPQITSSTIFPTGRSASTSTWSGTSIDAVVIGVSSNGVYTVITASSSSQPTHTTSTIPKRVEHSYTWTTRLSSALKSVAISTIGPPGPPAFDLTYPRTPYETIASHSGSHPTTALLTLASNARTSFRESTQTRWL